MVYRMVKPNRAKVGKIQDTNFLGVRGFNPLCKLFRTAISFILTHYVSFNMQAAANPPNNFAVFSLVKYLF